MNNLAIKSINPANDEEIKSYPVMNDKEISKIISLSNDDYQNWKETDFSERSIRMKRAGQILRKNREALGKLMTIEMGKPILQSESEIEKCAWVCDYFAENAEKFLEDEIIATDASKSFVAYKPLGVVLAVMP
ncbi:MAG TPA: aldehyde dehydrogenase family protein, partial [Ignavibacteriaceae bacterium]|nr:aldehyde dehydrogenase family protein [Ignavibacteriaceae bacterium]